MISCWKRLWGLNLCTFAALLVVGIGIVSSIFWQPAPNRVRIPLIDNTGQTVLQVYYRYGFPGPGSYFEYYSDVELLHATHDTLVAEFRMPGWRKLRAIRLDLGREVRDFVLGPVEFGFESAYRYHPLFELDGEEVLNRWQPNNQIGSGNQEGPNWRVRTAGEDSYLILPLSRSDWLGSLSPRVLWQLRGIRLLYFGLVAGLFYLAGRLVRSGWLSRAGGEYTPRWNRLWWIVSLAGVAVLGFWVYEPYLLFRKMYLFRDVATDSVDVFWPMFTHIAEYFRTEGYPLWSFSVGAGQGIFNWIGDPFLFILYALPPKLLGFGMGWVQFLKTLVAAVFFLGWLRLLGIGRYAASVAVVGLVFSGHMVIRGNWNHYASEVVMVAFALFAFECFLRKRIWHLLPLAILFLVIRGVYHTYVWSILFFGYALLRLWMEAGWKPKWIAGQVLRLGACYVLGLGLSAVFFLPNLYEIFSSPRVSGSESGILEFAQSALYSINPPEEWLSSLYGIFAPDILGRGIFYSGWRNYLEGPHLYAGTLVVLLLPQALIGRRPRTRWILWGVLLAILLYIFVPYVRYCLNAFSGVYYKTSSFWIPVALAGIAAVGLDDLIRKRKLDLCLLGGTLLVCVVALLFLRNSEYAMEFVRVKESYRVYRHTLYLLFGYSALLVFLRYGRSRPAALLLIPLLLVWEVGQFARESTQDRFDLRADSLTTHGFYFDDSYDAVAMIEAADSSFYRIEKGPGCARLNDPLGQGFKGLTSYYSFNAGGYLDFLGTGGFDVDYRVPGLGSSYVCGMRERYVLETLLSMKYYIMRSGEESSLSPFYKAWGRAGDSLIYENTCFVPFGSVYFSTISEEEMRALRPGERDLVALAAAVVPEAWPVEGLNELPKVSRETLEEIDKRTLHGPREERERLYFDLAKALGTHAVEWTNWNSNRFEGNIELDRPGLLFVSIPDNRGWTAEVNEKKVEVIPVHFGFKGVLLNEGKNDVVFKYFPPMMRAGIAISLATILIVLALIITPIGKFLKGNQPPDS
tara:strand:- start:1463 stop:4540 length:3078 start_codon:yes stop_codon:yes gene_type:complete